MTIWVSITQLKVTKKCKEETIIRNEIKLNYSVILKLYLTYVLIHFLYLLTNVSFGGPRVVFKKLTRALHM